MRLITLFIGIVLMVVVFFAIQHLMPGQSEKGLPVATPQVFVKDVPTSDIYTARADISIGTIMTRDMLDIQPWPKHLLLPDMVQADPHRPTEIVGMVVRTPFQKGEPVILNKLANASDPSFLAASLPKGMRVVTIAVDTVSGAGGFVFPGDRVDVLVTHDINLGKDDTGPKPEGAPKTLPKKDAITEVLLPNIRVMAVNQKSTAHGGEQPIVPSSVSLEVSAADAQKLRLVENGNGRLSLALRSLKDKDDMDLVRPTGMGDLSHLTPPAYFSVLYDTAGKANYTPKAVTPDQTPTNDDQGNKISIMVVRGVKAEAVEVTQP